MTLIQIIRKYLFISMLAILLLGCISHFFIFRFFINYSTDHMLNDQRKKIEHYVAAHDTLSLATTLVLEPARIEKRQISASEKYPYEIYKDTVMYSEVSGTFTPYRQLYFVVSYKDETHLVNINQPVMVSNDLLYAIISSLLILFILFIAFTYIIGYLLKKNIWSPLNKNLQRLYDYDLKANTKLSLQNSNIKEFDDINNVIMRMVKKINEDYENYRLFTEDASHEMQTPLSIIKSKLDMLLQHESLKNDAKQLQVINSLSRTVIRLSKLNKSLLLITRINNDQYKDKSPVRIDNMIESYLIDLGELIQAKKLDTNYKIEPCEVYINPALSEILISNLLSNAIKHSIPGGKMEITLTDSSLAISNSCEVGKTDIDLFKRMAVAQNRSGESSGLGLNIVKSICDKNNFDVHYSYPEKNVFRISVLFKYITS